MTNPSVGDRNRSKTHCPKGHEYTPENTTLQQKGKGRVSRLCKTCRTLSRRTGRRPAGQAQREHEAKWMQFLSQPETAYKTKLLEAKVLYDQWIADCQADKKRKHPNLRVGKEAP